MSDFILNIPEWEGTIVFSREVITFVIVIIALIAAVAMCFWGFRYFQTLALILLSCICGMIGFHIGERMTSNTVLQMCIFVIFSFLGICLLYFLSLLWSSFLSKLKIHAFVQRSLHIIASISGALVAGILTYIHVYKNPYIVIAGTLLLAIGGSWYGIRSATANRVFHTYDDLYKMKPLTEEKTNA